MTGITLGLSAGRPPASGPVLLSAVLLVPTVALLTATLGRDLPVEEWLAAAWSPRADDMAALTVHYVLLPRFVMALLVGAALGLSGALFQQVLRNPIAEPGTLGVSTGAYLAITLGTFVAPQWFADGREPIALAGALAAMLAVFGFASRQALSPLALILAGLVVNLICAAVATVLGLFNDQGLATLFLWASGSLAQQDWSGVTYLLPRVLGAAVLCLVALRPLTVAGLEEDTVRGLGLSPARARVLGLVIAVALAGFVVSAVGVIGFVGLAAPILARLVGARRFADRLLWAPVIGSGLLGLTDQLVARVDLGARELPAGVVTAVIGGPLLVLLLPLLRRGAEAVTAPYAPARLGGGSNGVLAICLIGLVPIVWIALFLGQDQGGWAWAGFDHIGPLLPWRAPRVLGALVAGAMLAAAGCLIQRFTGNPMAGPEVLGIGAGGVMLVIVLMMAGLSLTLETQTLVCVIGTLGTFAALLLLGRRSGFAADRLLLVGIAINTGFSAFVALFISGGDPRALAVLRWVSGSTYLLDSATVLRALTLMVLLLALALLLHRWLAILPLGEATTRAVGVDPRRARFVVLTIAALLTAGGTLIVGPMSFIGLMAPHMAAMLGMRGPRRHLLCACGLGAGLIIVADWVGRMVLFPNEIPAGLVATLIGGPYFLWLLQRRTS
ncbi:MAG: Fe(3+)-hydroxamate ABC transporter permease FhuB [Rhodospirillum sp.]|nr:Fe(3+)-hydroxamate ABC transporter permease FhuB [Rhodospirillum sp.]MCF8490246.1 Fe(3+)-hydroxamate ABC transporter permease FhuB [Rhodospirillum sp.]MCF8501257.1 Fe(3+)-hydroxamate ABC transporter permease FhuB [Rhodospirillum sp.]